MLCNKMENNRSLPLSTYNVRTPDNIITGRYKQHIPENVRIVSWNILAPELLLYFWRGSYGLNISNDKFYYDDINKNRIDNIITKLREYNADIVCLQEITNLKYEYLEGKSIVEYISDKLDYYVVSESYKHSPFKYNYPPSEQLIRRTGSMEVDSGVATLLKMDSKVQLVENIGRAEDFKGVYPREYEDEKASSNVFSSGVGSPFVLDLFEYEYRHFFVGNVHIRMQYPSILQPLNEVHNRISNVLSEDELRNMVLVGDFNAHGLQGARELFASDLHKYMFDEQGSELIDDHIFLGNDMRFYGRNIYYDKNVRLLNMDVNSNTADKNRWSIPQSKYNLSIENNELVNMKVITSDHYPIILTLDFSRNIVSTSQAI
ncbi:Endonuclease/exonuclease/phosphatase family protein [Orpheovirus IHUMI-LCC2]|uniref:Endonuclease/exonuclease/phosphatase family protein n=1 Tax=Orpheovirus IHUMI-LCC2 TaxID=2023057 RepID=A0A2I2L550_9VIRU|nr:Endonuclease/exonuclease/phosphatase family protein [Orpheovirus IHUMI-LCC2]SNW62646.1 Endonuclease/exonuclease/phosphatase family protein [Orpheovirus IHUMI-LCC2]